METDAPLSGADRIAELADELDPLLAALQALLPDQIGDPTVGTTAHRKNTVGSPAPWHAQAAAALMDIHEGVRRMEASMRIDISGQPGRRRGGSTANTAAALASLVRLGYGLDDRRARYYARILQIWITHAQQLRDIDEAPRWIAIHVPKGQLPPTCPYCSTYSLRVAENSGAVRCINRRCLDTTGKRPYGLLERGQYTGRPLLAFADGREIHYQDQEAS